MMVDDDDNEPDRTIALVEEGGRDDADFVVRLMTNEQSKRNKLCFVKAHLVIHSSEHHIQL